ncbi:MAG: tetratricopeptide repeat protein [Halobacteriovoraceae bacterium]|jgi:tetratricopeptide (TPR) repeat protein|nr:tetratricopeptide repeat protein [Halobacteriovoraceae bacterium]MBT5092900.1 tetratricopeptide repeat protein [Halobacteriovoraceae bacterium]
MADDDFNSPILRKYLKTYEEDPRSRVFAPLAESFRKMGMVEKALAILRDGIRYHPTYTMGYLGLAFCYKDLAQFNLAYTTLRPLVSDNRDNFRLQKLFSEVCLELGNEPEALDTLKYLLFINPRDQETAEKVKSLEKGQVISEPEVPELESFSIETMTTGPVFGEEKIDEWIQLDLSGPEAAAESTLTDQQTEEQSNWDMVDLKSKGRPEPIATTAPEAEGPVITHTLVDLYYSQGYVDKAIEILEKILALNPGDERSSKRLEELQATQREHDSAWDVEPVAAAEESNEGRDKLMQHLDQSLAAGGPPLHAIEDALWEFHRALSARSKEFKN